VAQRAQRAARWPRRSKTSAELSGSAVRAGEARRPPGASAGGRRAAGPWPCRQRAGARAQGCRGWWAGWFVRSKALCWCAPPPVPPAAAPPCGARNGSAPPPARAAHVGGERCGSCGGSGGVGSRGERGGRRKARSTGRQRRTCAGTLLKGWAVAVGCAPHIRRGRRVARRERRRGPLGWGRRPCPPARHPPASERGGVRSYSALAHRAARPAPRRAGDACCSGAERRGARRGARRQEGEAVTSGPRRDGQPGRVPRAPSAPPRPLEVRRVRGRRRAR